MNEFEQQIRNVWVQYLTASQKKDAETIAKSCEIEIEIATDKDDPNHRWLDKTFIEMPVASLHHVKSDESLEADLVNALVAVLDRQYYADYQCTLYINMYHVTIRALLTTPKEEQKSTWRSLFKWFAII